MDKKTIKNLSEILNKLNIPYLFKEEEEMFIISMKTETDSHRIAIWYRKAINALHLYSLIKVINFEEANKLALKILMENEGLAYGSLGVFHDESNEEYSLTYNLTISLERGNKCSISEEEFREYFSFISYILPKITEEIVEKNLYEEFSL